MTAQKVVLCLALVVGSTAAMQSAAFAQESRGTMEQQMACTPDVWRLCSDQIPDRDRIVGCLRQNTRLLSGPCRAVFESNNTAQQQSPRGRAVPPPRYADPRVMPQQQQQPYYEDDDDN
jgi:hypothetical protein